MNTKLATIVVAALCVTLLFTLSPLAAGSSLPAPVPAQVDGTPQPCNPDFEHGFREVDDIPQLTVANNWLPWYVEQGEVRRPEYGPERGADGEGGANGTRASRVLSGTYAQKQSTGYAAHDGGLYQRIEGVTKGQWYTFSAWVYVWSSDRGDADVSAAPTGKYSALVGINPWGDCSATYRTTIWGKEALEVYDRWVQVSVTAPAWEDTVCVFTRGTAVWAVRDNASYWDAVTFEEVAGPAPQPTYTPYPTYTPRPVPTCPPCPSLEEIRRVIREELEDRP